MQFEVKGLFRKLEDAGVEFNGRLVVHRPKV